MEELILKLLMKKYGDDSKKLEILRNYENDEQLKRFVTNIRVNISWIEERISKREELGGEKVSLTRSLHKRRIPNLTRREKKILETDSPLADDIKRLRRGVEGSANALTTLRRINEIYGPKQPRNTFRKDS